MLLTKHLDMKLSKVYVRGSAFTFPVVIFRKKYKVAQVRRSLFCSKMLRISGCEQMGIGD